MIARIFDKSKPINFVIVFSITLFAFLFAQFKDFKGDLYSAFLFKGLGAFLLCLTNIVLLNFIVSKNNLTQKSSYKILLFSLFFAMVPWAMNNLSILVSNLFVLLALRRIISLKSLLSVKKKLFDASVLITLASLLHFWSILFMLMVFAALVFYSENKFKNWIIPFAALITMAIIFVAYHVILFDHYGKPLDYMDAFDFNYENYNDPSINRKLKNFRPSFIIILIMAIISVIVGLVSPDKNGSELLFLFAPLAVIVTNYIEVIEEKWFKEILLAILILIPISFQFFG